MNDRDLAAYLDYMRAHLRVQDPRTVAQLNNLQLYDAFHTLPRPAVSFHEWLERTGRTEFATERAENTAKGRGQSSAHSALSEASAGAQSEAQIEAQNARGLAALGALQAHGFPVSISAKS